VAVTRGDIARVLAHQSEEGTSAAKTVSTTPEEDRLLGVVRRDLAQRRRAGLLEPLTDRSPIVVPTLDAALDLRLHARTVVAATVLRTGVLGLDA
jgi:hypothetical protein